MCFPPQHLVHRAADSSGALHHEACLPRLLQKDVPQQYRLHQSPRPHGGVITLHKSFIFFMFLFFFHHLGCDLNFDGDRHCHQRKELFFECQLYSLCSNFSEYSSTVEDQPVMHWSLTVTFFSHLLNVTSLKQWTPLTLLRSLSGAQTSAVFCMYGLLLFLPRMSLFIHEDFLFYDETLTFWD